MHDEGLEDGSGQLISVLDYERAAAGRLEPGTLNYFAGGAADEITMRDNVASWGRLAIVPRMLVGVGERDLGVTLLGVRRPHPVIVAPMAFQALAHPEGELATARAAASTGSIMCLATLATTGVAALAEATPDASRWFQLYVFRDRGWSRELAAQAVEHGYEALIVTADVPVPGLRERELRQPAHPPGDRVANARATAGARTPEDFIAQIDPDLTWKDIESFASDFPLPVIVKGILRSDDARLALEHGARAVVVSNHGGRQLDSVPSGADALPAVAQEVGGELDVLVDGGIRRGTDVLKALALGARSVLVGRPVLWGLAVDGAAGAQRVLETLVGEFDRALALAGVRRADALDPSLIAPSRW
jgi:4-hydroxymandelate oxidase